MNESVKVLLQFVIVPIVSGVTALGGVWLAQKKQAKQELLKDQRALRDQKRERLRRLYERVVLAGLAFKQHIVRRNYVLEGETVEQRDQALEKYLAEATKNLDEVQVSLMLDADGKRILNHLQAVIDGSRKYNIILGPIREYRQGGGDYRKELEKTWDEVEVNLTALRDVALAHLEELQGPIGE